MENYSHDSASTAEAPAPQEDLTFRGVVDRNFRGHIERFGKHHELTPHYRAVLRALFSRERSVEMSGAVMRKVAELLGKPVEECFPPDQFRRQMFSGIAKTPVFAALQKKFGIRFHTQRNSVESLLRERGMSDTDINRLRNIAVGNFSVQGNAVFCRKVAESLGMTVAELLPPETYGELPPPKEKPVHDAVEAPSGHP